MAKSRSAKASFKDYLHLKAELTSSDSPVIGLFGSSESLIESALDMLRICAKERSAEISTIEGASLNEPKFNAMAHQTSLFEPITFYVVRRAEQAKLLPKLLKSLSPQQLRKNWAHRLVLIWSGGEPSTSVAGELKRLQAFMLPCMEPWPNEVPQVIQMYAKSLGFKLHTDAVHAMIEVNGLDLIKHRHELNKIALITHGNVTPLGKDDIAPLLGLLREDDAFQLDRLLIQGHWSEAQALLESLLSRGEKALGILSILSNHCRNVIKINSAMIRGHQLASLAQETKLPTFLLKNYLPMAGRVNVARYIRALDFCYEADLALKSRPIAESLILSQVLDALAQLG